MKGSPQREGDGETGSEVEVEKGKTVPPSPFCPFFPNFFLQATALIVMLLCVASTHEGENKRWVAASAARQREKRKIKNPAVDVGSCSLFSSSSACRNLSFFLFALISSRRSSRHDPHRRALPGTRPGAHAHSHGSTDL